MQLARPPKTDAKAGHVDVALAHPWWQRFIREARRRGVGLQACGAMLLQEALATTSTSKRGGEQ